MESKCRVRSAECRIAESLHAALCTLHSAFVAVACFLWFLASPAFAQQSGPQISYIYPAGLQQGTTYDVMIGGQGLDGINTALVCGAGVQAEVIALVRPIQNQKDAVEKLRQELKDLQTRKAGAAKMADKTLDPRVAPFVKPLAPEEERRLTEIPLQLAYGQRRPSSPALAQTAFVRLTIAGDAEPGARDLRLRTANGLSNPMSFHIGRLPEMREQETRPTTAPANRAFTVPAVVNGQIMPGEVDRYRFNARKSQHLVIVASARELIPYVADAVPGWFQATLALYDKSGRELAYVDDYKFNPDPVLHFEVPRDDEYILEIKDSIYRGREDFVYRLTISERPFVTGIFPLGGQAGLEAKIDVKGWNLAAGKASVDARQMSPGIHAVALGGAGATQGGVPFAVDTLPECLDQEPNNATGNAQQIKMPIIVNGRIDAPGDMDVFRIDGRAGQRIVAEVLARRLNSPLDSAIMLTDSSGKQVAFNDDLEDRGAGLTTHHADSYLLVTLPADGVYYLALRDTQGKGGPDYAYRLRLSAPRPDFELRVTPASVTVGQGGHVPLTVHAMRRDGFSGDIVLTMKDAPAGFAITGGLLPAGQDKVRITLTAAKAASKEPQALQFEGRAAIDGKDVVHPAVPAEDMMQAFLYRHLVAASEMKVVVAGRGWSSPKLASAEPVKIPAGGTAKLAVQIGTANATEVEAQLNEPPEGIVIKSTTLIKGGLEIVFESDAAKIKPGTKGNLIVSASSAIPGNQRRNQLGTLPAIAFEIVAK